MGPGWALSETVLGLLAPSTPTPLGGLCKLLEPRMRDGAPRSQERGGGAPRSGFLVSSLDCAAVGLARQGLWGLNRT